MSHTYLPWEVGELDKNSQRIVRGQHIEICTCWHHSVESIEREMEANAAFIVKAVNNHALLVGLLGSCLEDYGSLRFTDRHRMADRIRDALAKVQS